MITDILELNNFIVLIEQSDSAKPIVQSCVTDGDVVGFAFYGSGSVGLEIKHNNQIQYLTNAAGLAISFYGNEKVEFSHTIAPGRPLQSVSVFARIRNLHTLPATEREIFSELVPQLLNPTTDFVKGPSFYLTHDMQHVVQKIFNTTHKGNIRSLFLKSQVHELLAHFFALVSGHDKQAIVAKEEEKLFHAREIVTNSLTKPPSLDELARMVGMNNYKLKKNFKAMFGVPVFKYLQDERLKKAYDVLSNREMSVQETAWFVGYESLSSFSNAFQKKFGLRPADVRQHSFSNKS